MYEAKPLDILPGIFMEASDYASQGRYVDGDNVRFWKGYPERIGGNDTISDDRCYRPPRSSHAWRALDTSQLMAFGHAMGVQVLQGGNLYDVSPLGTSGFARLTVSIGSVTGGPFQTNETVTTANGATGSLVAAAATTPLLVSGHNGTHKIAFTGGAGTFLVGETITGSGGGSARVMLATSSTPIYLYEVSGTLTGTITGAVSGATATAGTQTELWTGTVTGGTSGATATISGYADTGKVDSGATTAWGESTFGSSVFGGTESLYSSVIDCTTWTFVNWGEDLVANVRLGAIYALDVSAFIADTTTNLTPISGAPSSALGVVMNQDNRTLIAYGAHDGSASDFCNIRWCDEEDYTEWAASASNTAGSIRCENGSVIIGMLPARGGWLVSTDTAIYSFRYIGLPFVFSLTQLAIGPSLVSPRSAVEQDGVTYWMGKDGFYQYDGSVNPLPCDLHQWVFGGINLVQAFKIHAGTCRAFNEVWWYFAWIDDGIEIGRYISYNTVEKTWAKGTKARTSWIDSSVVVSYPVGTKSDGSIHAEEYGLTDAGEDIDYLLETSDIEIDDGTVGLHNRMVIPDYKRISGDSHTLTIESRGFPQRAARTKGPFNICSSSGVSKDKLSVRVRGSKLRYKWEGSDDFRMGRWRTRVTGHGERE
jgi:hypothetical protein